MSADLLRKAAERVRADSREDVTIITAEAGLALADWLDSVPACADCEPAMEAHEVARLIVGEES